MGVCWIFTFNLTVFNKILYFQLIFCLHLLNKTKNQKLMKNILHSNFSET